MPAAVPVPAEADGIHACDCVYARLLAAAANSVQLKCMLSLRRTTRKVICTLAGRKHLMHVSSNEVNMPSVAHARMA